MGQAGGPEFRSLDPLYSWIRIWNPRALVLRCGEGGRTGHPKACEPASLAHTEDSVMEDKVAGRVWYPRLSRDLPLPRGRETVPRNYS